MNVANFGPSRSGRARVNGGNKRLCVHYPELLHSVRCIQLRLRTEIKRDGRIRDLNDKLEVGAFYILEHQASVIDAEVRLNKRSLREVDAALDAQPKILRDARCDQQNKG